MRTASPVLFRVLPAESSGCFVSSFLCRALWRLPSTDFLSGSGRREVGRLTATFKAYMSLKARVLPFCVPDEAGKKGQEKGWQRRLAAGWCAEPGWHGWETWRRINTASGLGGAGRRAQSFWNPEQQASNRDHRIERFSAWRPLRS